ncbi:MAG: carboxypeptidase-like regulatory domain-containing protein [Nitrospirota bacterium]|nr:carboxypeptidase-like regulatory domain-containing protein [Nitrospirota bacterium]MDH5585552.1 carboxypeptidase-like regulatory domain-containing protein [Nitrospirota bacterium]MDH5774952.1 carboxypeptidase-like regulatory domain-containing protein [Nitrospirota bacterium]
MNLLALIIAMGWFVIGEGSFAFAYEVKNIEDGGTITGTVTLNGGAPVPKAYNLITFPDPEYCGRISDGKGWRLLKDFVVNNHNQVQGVVMVLEGVSAGKPFTLSIPKVEAKDCQFLPFTTVVRSEHGIEVVNMDPVMHDIQAYETSQSQGTRVLFNSPLPFNRKHQRENIHATHAHMPGTSMVHQFHLSKGRQTFVMQCGFHAYMESWAIAVDNPYFAFTSETGSYEITDIPPGTYRLRAWHPSVKHEDIQTVTVQAAQMTQVDISLDSPARRWTAHTRQTPPRFTPAALGRPIVIEPLVEHQRP